ncbi:MAG: hypothetical protein J5528_01270 [Firmicutes bacterium]|nr:hypothetical protein [Bacillota bacterium]
MRKSIFKISILIVTGVLLMLGLFGCGKQKYKLDLPFGFESKKDSYAAGEEVKVTYGIIATDTDYSFYSDADDVKREYTDSEGYVFTFIMPERDVTFWVESRNSMEYLDPSKEYTEDELAGKIDGERMVFDYYDAVVGTDGGDRYTELVLYRWEEDDLLLAKYTKEYGEEELVRVCRVPVSYLYDCLAAVNRNGMKSWKDGDGLDGMVYVVRFKNGNDYMRISSEDMPEGGTKAFAEIKTVLDEAWSFYGPKGAYPLDPGVGIIDDPVIEEEEK